jgi:voltage-gated potassium channel
MKKPITSPGDRPMAIATTEAATNHSKVGILDEPMAATGSHPVLSQYQRLKKDVHLLLDPRDGGAAWDKVVNSTIIGLIVLNVLAVILETVESLERSWHAYFQAFEVLSITVFSIEYLLRLWSCTVLEKYHHPFKGRVRFLFSPSSMIDLIAIVPFFLPLLIAYDLRFIRIFRLVRFIRFFKLSRYLNASKVIRRVIAARKEELVISLTLTFTLIIVASSVMFFVEHEAQPDKFSSIPETMWWSVATLTTVGYGDMYPVTDLGKTLTAFISILGIGMFALPAGILASGFSDEFKKSKSKPIVCPHCGREEAP